MTKRMLLAVAGAVAVASTLAVAGSATVRVVPTNVNVTKTSGNEDESTIAIDPAAPSKLFVATNTASTSTYWRSSDDGSSWTQVTPGLVAACCDVQAAWDSFGNLFITYINSALNTVELAVSSDGGQTFTQLPAVDVGNIDQPSVAVGAGSVWVSWNKSGSMFARGAAVTALGTVGAYGPTETVPSGTGSFGDIAVGRSGQVTVTYQDLTASEGPSTIYANTDVDGLGAGSFGARVTVTSTNVGGFDFIPAQRARSVDAEAGLAYDRTGGALNGRLYLVYTDETPNESNNMDIFVRTSTTSGATWGAAVKVNDDATTRSQFLPHISVDQTTETVGVTWHDARNDGGVPGSGSTNVTANDDVMYYGAFSTGGGATFGSNVQISAGVSNASDAAAPVDYGDYAWSDFYRGELHAVWSDNSNSTGDNPAGALKEFDQYTAKVTGPPTAVDVATVEVHRKHTGSAVVTWTTGGELGVLGFNVFRAAARKAVRVNRALVPAQGRVGAFYRIVDPHPPTQARATYRVQIVGRDGARAWRGTATLEPTG